jgi:hypothetical protein
MISNETRYPVTGHGRAAVSARVVSLPPTMPPTPMIFGAGVCPQTSTATGGAALDLRVFEGSGRIQLDVQQFRSDKPVSGPSVWRPPV